MATKGKGLRDFLADNRERGRDDEDDRPSRSRSRDDDDREPESERRPARRSSREEDDRPSRTRSRDDEDDRPSRSRSRDDEDDRPRNSRRNHTPRAGRFTGMPSAQERPPQLEEGKHLLRIVKTYESDNPKNGSWFQIHVEILDSGNKKYRPGDTTSLRYHTERKSMQVTGPKITSFVRAACGFKTDEDMRKRVPKMSESGKAGYDVLIDAALGEPEAEDEFGKNPLEDRVLLVDATKGKYDEDRDIQYYEFEWTACDQKRETLDDGAAPRRRNGRDAEEEDRPARAGRSSRGDSDDERPSRGRDSERGSRASERDAKPSRGRAREEPDEEEDEDEDREEERPRARSRR